MKRPEQKSVEMEMWEVEPLPLDIPSCPIIPRHELILQPLLVKDAV